MRNIIILLTFFVIVSCSSKNNYETIKDYFNQTKDTTSLFIINCGQGSKNDSVKICEHLDMSNEKFEYTLDFKREIIDDKLKIIFTPSTISVTEDSYGYCLIIQNSEYSRSTDSIFTIPKPAHIIGKFGNTKGDGMYDYVGDFNSEYKLYCSFDNQDLVIHRDFTYKSLRKWSYYFSKDKGLYKIIINESGVCTALRQ